VFTSYRNFDFVSKEEMKSSSILTEYIVKGVVDKVVKIPFMDEQVETLDVYLDSMSWKHSSDGSYVCREIENQINLWEVNNNKRLQHYK
jgi:hypothetical protein